MGDHLTRFGMDWYKEAYEREIDEKWPEGLPLQQLAGRDDLQVFFGYKKR